MFSLFNAKSRLVAPWEVYKWGKPHNKYLCRVWGGSSEPASGADFHPTNLHPVPCTYGDHFGGCLGCDARHVAPCRVPGDIAGVSVPEGVIPHRTGPPRQFHPLKPRLPGLATMPRKRARIVYGAF
jgi:hypothetical protein